MGQIKFGKGFISGIVTDSSRRDQCVNRGIVCGFAKLTPRLRIIPIDSVLPQCLNIG